MKKALAATLAACLALAALPAEAHGPWRGAHRGHHGHHGHHGSIWPGVAVVGALTGLAIAIDQSRPRYAVTYYEPPQPAYGWTPPAAAPSATPGTWYYCQSSALYYPYTMSCPEGWQMVPARPY